MAKGDQENTMGGVASQRTADQNAIKGIQSGITKNIGSVDAGTGLASQQASQLANVSGKFENFAGTGGVSDEIKQNLSAGPGGIVGSVPSISSYGGFGGYTAPPRPDYSEPQTGYRDLAATGGVNLGNATDTYHRLEGPNSTTDNIVSQLSNVKGMQGGVDDTISRLKDLSLTGGISDAEKSNVLRPLFYENEKTGGYTPEQIANIKKESNSTIPSYFSSLADSLSRQRAASGYSPGYGAAQQTAARQGAVAAGDQSLKTNIGLSDTIRQGQMDAAKSIQAGQLGMSQITSPVKLGALSSAGDLGINEVGQQITGLTNAGGLNIDQQKVMLAAASGDTTAQQLIQSGKIAGLGGLTDIVARNQAAAAAAAGGANSNSLAWANLLSNDAMNRARLSSSNVLGLGQMTQQGQQYGTSGLSHLLDSTNSQMTDQQKMLLSTIGMNSDQQARLLGIQAGLSNNPGQGSQAANNLSKAAGAISSGAQGFNGGQPGTGGNTFGTQPVPGTNPGDYYGPIEGSTGPNGNAPPGDYYGPVEGGYSPTGPDFGIGGSNDDQDWYY